jgi:hypothetical protein
MIGQRTGDRGRLLKLLGFLTICSVPAILGLDAVGEVAALFPLADSPHPYLVLAHAVLLYVWSPLVVGSASVLMLAPGLCLALLSDASASLNRWILFGFAISVTTLPFITPLIESLTATPLRGRRFLALLAAATLAAWSVTLVRSARGRVLHWPMAERGARSTLVGMIVVPLAILAALTPKFYWDNFNGDGVHAFEASRLLLSQAVPFFSPEAGATSAFPGVTSMLFAFPASWYIRLFGPLEASIRFSLLLYLPPLVASIVALAEYGRVRPLAALERWIVWLPIAVYVVALGYSATYNPYSADFALPATQDTLQMVCVLGGILAFVERRRAWLVLFTALSFVASPNGAMLLGLWLLAVWLVRRPRADGDLGFAIAALVGCAIAGAILPLGLASLHLPVPGREYGLKNILVRFAYLQWWDWRRLLFVVVPSGIIPMAAMLHWKSQDDIARALTIVVVAYFVFFYVQAYTVLHYFVPVMLLPIVIFWRSRLTIGVIPRSAVCGLAVACGVVALAVSLPANAAPHTAARRIGAELDAQGDGYETSGALALGRSEVLSHLFPFDWDGSVPERGYGGSPLVWNYYAHRPKPEPRTIHYVILGADRPAPAGMSLLGREAGAALYLNDLSALARDRALKLPSPAGPRVYMVPRWMIFRLPVPRGQRHFIDVADLLERWGLPVAAVRKAVDSQR